MKICFKRKERQRSATYEFLTCAIAFACILVILESCKPRILKPFLRAQKDEYINSKVYREANKIAKATTLETYGITRIQDEEIHQFFYARMSLIYGPGVCRTTGRLATAVSPNGYFLTAAHCLLDEAGNRIDPLRVAGLTKENNYVARADVIWMSEYDDLALIYAPIKQEKWFPMVDASLDIGSTVIAGGYYCGHGAGKILSLTERSSELPRSICLQHSIPLTRGDSGGPLSDMNGQLIGINCNITFTPLSVFRKPRLKWAKSHFVSKDWLQRLIKDHRNQINSEE